MAKLFQSLAAVVAVVGVALLLAGADAAPSRKRPPPAKKPTRRPPPSAPLPKPCVFTPANPLIPASCSPNPAYTVAVANPIIAKGSGWGKVFAAAAKAEAACAAHDVSTAAGKAACRADTKNRCSVHFSGGYCFATMTNYLLTRDYACPGAPWTEYTRCTSASKEECTPTLSSKYKCVWDEPFWYGGASTYAAEKDGDIARMGGPLQYGACIPEEYVKATVLPDGEVDVEAYREWYYNNIGGAGSPAAWEAARGTCEYANKTYARNLYLDTCSGVNTIFVTLDTYAVSTDTNINMTLISECRAKGCNVVPIAGSIYANLGVSPRFNGSVAFICTADAVRVTQLNLDPVLDAPMYQAWSKCNALINQEDQELCEGVTMP